MRITIFYIALLFSFLMSACSPKTEADFSGKWVDVKYEKRIMTITKNGNHYVVVWETGMSTEQSIGTVKEGILMFGKAKMIFDETTGLLIGAGSSYKKTDT